MSELQDNLPIEYIVDLCSSALTVYDVKGLTERILSPGKTISVEEIRTNYKPPFKEVLKKCLEKDPISTIEYLVRKYGSLLREVYDIYSNRILALGAEEKDPQKIHKLLERWKKLKKSMEEGNGVVLKEDWPPSDIITEEKEPRGIKKLEKYLESLTPNS